MDAYPQLGMYIKRLSNRMEAEANKHLRDENLTYSQLGILHFLAMNRGKKVSQKDICKFKMSSHASVIDVLKRLEEKGLLERRTDDENYRCNNVTITEQGAALLESVRVMAVAHDEQLLEGFSDKEKAALFGYLDRVLSNIN